jgi:hypothetical protein
MEPLGWWLNYELPASSKLSPGTEASPNFPALFDLPLEVENCSILSEKYCGSQKAGSELLGLA